MVTLGILSSTAPVSLTGFLHGQAIALQSLEGTTNFPQSAADQHFYGLAYNKDGRPFSKTSSEFQHLAGNSKLLLPAVIPLFRERLHATDQVRYAIRALTAASLDSVLSRQTAQALLENYRLSLWSNHLNAPARLIIDTLLEKIERLQDKTTISGIELIDDLINDGILPPTFESLENFLMETGLIRSPADQQLDSTDRVIPFRRVIGETGEIHVTPVTIIPSVRFGPGASRKKVISTAANTLPRTLAIEGRFNSPYLLQQVLGEGAQATVYRAYDRMLRREVAIKALSIENLDAVYAAKLTECMAREAELQARIQEHSIVTVYERGLTTKGAPFIVMEILDSNLYEWAISHDYDLNERLTISEQVVTAALVAHDQKIIHRDIKPENLFLYRGKARLGDFGLACQEDEDCDAAGTPHFMPPEAFTHERKESYTRDVYALGVTLYQLFTDVLPFNSPNSKKGNALCVDQLMKKLRNEARPLRHVSPTRDIPIEIQGIILTALSRNPEDRYKNAGTMLYELLTWRAQSLEKNGQLKDAIDEYKRARDRFPAPSNEGQLIRANRKRILRKIEELESRWVSQLSFDSPLIDSVADIVWGQWTEPVGLWSNHAGFRLRAISQAGKDLLGQEISSTVLKQRCHPDDLSSLKEFLDTVATTGSGRLELIRLKKTDGYVHYDLHAATIGTTAKDWGWFSLIRADERAKALKRLEANKIVLDNLDLIVTLYKVINSESGLILPILNSTKFKTFLGYTRSEVEALNIQGLIGKADLTRIPAMVQSTIRLGTGEWKNIEMIGKSGPVLMDLKAERIEVNGEQYLLVQYKKSGVKA